MAPPSLVCPRCGAPRILSPECPECGVIYAKAHARPRASPLPGEKPKPAPLAPERPFPVEPFASEAPVEGVSASFPSERFSLEEAESSQRELWIRLVALPAALVLTWGLMRTSFARPLLRTFVSMWIHETGHAVTAWLCGYAAFPGPWFTPLFGRSLFVVLILAGALGYGTWWSFRARQFQWAVAGAALLLLQLFCTLGLTHDRHMMLFTFGGDAGMMLLGSALMTTLYVEPASPLHKRQLRWAFLAFGAIAFMDAFEEWWGCRSDVDRLPLGSLEGAGLSDASKLLDVHLWSATQLIHRYTTLGLACLAALALLYALKLRQAHARAKALLNAHRTLGPRG